MDSCEKAAFVSRQPATKLADVASLKSAALYDALLGGLVRGGRRWHDPAIAKCLAARGAGPRLTDARIALAPPADDVTGTAALVVEAADAAELQRLCRCFGLFESPGQPSRGLYRDALRFSLQQRHVVLLLRHSSPSALPGGR